MSRTLFSLLALLPGVWSLHSADLIAPPGDPRPPQPIEARATLTVDTSNPEDVIAKVHVEFQGYYAVTEQLPVQRDAAGRFLLAARVAGGELLCDNDDTLRHTHECSICKMR